MGAKGEMVNGWQDGGREARGRGGEERRIKVEGRRRDGRGREEEGKRERRRKKRSI